MCRIVAFFAEVKFRAMRIFPFVIVLMLVIGCEKAEIEEKGSRGTDAEQTDSATSKPSFTVPEWGDSIHVSY